MAASKNANNKCIACRVSTIQTLASCDYAMATNCSGLTVQETLVCIWMLISNLQNISLKLYILHGHSRAALILKCFHTGNPEVLVKAFCTYVRPILEYCTPVWSPHHIGLVDK